MTFISKLLVCGSLAVGIGAGQTGQTGTIVTAAGFGFPGTTGVGGPPRSLALTAPSCMVFDSSGRLLISDAGNGFVYRLEFSNTTTIVAGTGLPFYIFGPGPTANLMNLCVALDLANNIYTTDGANNRILRTDAVTGAVSTYAGNGSSVSSGDGGPATSAGIYGPTWVSGDSQGNLFVVEQLGHRIRRIDALTGVITTVAGNGTAGFSGDGGAATLASLNAPQAVSVDASGNLFVSDTSNYRVRRVDAVSGIITTIAGTGISLPFNGDGVQATATNLLPLGTVLDKNGNLLIASNNRVRRLNLSTGVIATVAGIEPLVSQLPTQPPDGTFATETSLSGLNGLAFLTTPSIPANQTGLLLLSEAAGHRVREVFYQQFSGYTATYGPLAPVPAVEGQPVTLSATVMAIDVGTPAGQLGFIENFTFLGSPVLVTNGSASVTIPSLTLGSHTFGALFDASNNTGSSRSPDFQVVVKRGSSVTLNSSTNPSTENGPPLSFSIMVTPATAGPPPSLTGSVQLMEGATILGSAVLNSGAAVVSTSLPAGSHSLTAVYSGDANYGSVTSAVYVQAVRGASALNLSTYINPPVAGQPNNIIANVTPPTATGTVQFLDGATVLGSAPIFGGRSTFLTNGLSGGQHTLTANYSGDQVTSPSTGTLSTFVLFLSNLTMTSSNPQQTVFSPVTFSVSISPASATGTIQFFNSDISGFFPLGTVAINSGVASLTVSNLSVGSHTILANYSGDASNTAGTSSLGQLIVKTVSTLALTSTPNPSTLQQVVTLRATVTPASATGAISFFAAGTLLATVPVTNGVALLTTSGLVLGTQSLTATYSGDGIFLGASAPAIPQTVNKGVTVSTVTASRNPVEPHDNVVFTATVSPAAVTGQVEFRDGSTVLRTATLTNGSATFGTEQLSKGTHSITVRYLGNSQYAASASAVLSEVVRKD